MTTVRDLYRQLGAKIAEGDGDLPLFAAHMASGAADPVAGICRRTQEDVTCEGPYDVEGDWIEVSIGH